MGLIDLFNKWIVERGSAVIQEKHLALFRDQFAAADKKIMSLDKDILILKAENSTLRSKNIILQEENRNLTAEIDQLTNKDEQPHVQHLEELKEKILVIVTQNEFRSDAQIAELAEITKPLTAFHLHGLKDLKLINSQFGLDEDSTGVDTWFVEQPGREYLVCHGLL